MSCWIGVLGYCKSLGGEVEIANLNQHLTIEGFTCNDPAFANSIGVWRNFSEPWDMAENGYKLIKEMREKHGM